MKYLSVITAQRPRGNGYDLASSATLIEPKPGETRADMFRAALNNLCQANQWPADGQGATVTFFSLEPNTLT